MNTILKRVGAYLIDYFIVNIIIYAILFIPFVNPKSEEYQIKYNELINVNEQLIENEISEEEFYDALVPIAYDLYRLNTPYVITSSIVFLLYFGVLEYYWKCQTVGKKLFKLKVISSNDKPLNVVNFIIRAIVLYNILIPILELIVVYTMPVNTYLPLYEKINMIGYIIMYITIFMMLVRKDNRGLHDLIAATKVEYDENLETFKIEKIFSKKELPKEEKTKKSTTKTKQTKSKKTTTTTKKTSKNKQKE